MTIAAGAAPSTDPRLSRDQPWPDWLRALSLRGFSVYGLFRQDRLVYIGRSERLRTRIKAHAWAGEIEFDACYFEAMPSRDEMVAYEAELIATHLPSANTAGARPVMTRGRARKLVYVMYSGWWRATG